MTTEKLRKKALKYYKNQPDDDDYIVDDNGEAVPLAADAYEAAYKKALADITTGLQGQRLYDTEHQRYYYLEAIILPLLTIE